MLVGFNKARGKLSPARVNGSLGLLPWMALHSRSLGSQAHQPWKTFLGEEGLTSPRHCFLAPGRKSIQPRGFKRTCSEETFPDLTLSPCLAVMENPGS